MTRPDPVGLRRRLRVELRKARLSAGLTQKDIAERLDWSPSKIIRIESGQVAVTIPDLRALLYEYGVTDEHAVEELQTVARLSKKQPFSQYRDLFGTSFIQFLGYESAASRILNYELIVIPGLLQTEDYTRALLHGAYGSTEGQVERIVESRLERQELLDQADPPRLHFLIDEAAIRRVVGGTAVMEAQLHHVSEQARRPNITVQIIPFPAGAHPGMLGPMIYLEFPEADVEDIVYIEGPHSTDPVFRDDPEGTTNYLQLFYDLERIASRPQELDAHLGRAIERLPVDEKEDPLSASTT